MTYSRRNSVEEQQEACQKARRITEVCENFHITLDPIDWQQYGMWAPVKVHNIEIAPLMDLGQRESEDILRQAQMKLFGQAALETLHARPGLKVLMWSPVDVIRPQEFLSLWIVTLETDERIPIVESLKNGQRTYDYYPFDRNDKEQLASLFGPASEGEYHVGDTVTIKERDRQYKGEVIYVIPAGKTSTNRKYTSRGYHSAAGSASTNDPALRYIVDCNDGFPHIVHQLQILRQ
jgi:hypothetical protein